MRRWDAARVAREAGARLQSPGSAPAARGPIRASVDSRTLEPGELFFGLPGERVDGGAHARAALEAGAWGAIVAPEHVASAASGGGLVLSHPDPLRALHALTRARRGELAHEGARVVAITGSSGKTSTKDILAALLAPHARVAANPQNLNTEIGLPLALLAAPDGVEVVVLEMAMRGSGQIAELTALADPDVGVIVNVGPVHLELLGSLEAIAAAKGELIAGMATGRAVVVPAGEVLLAPHLREDVRVITFGEGGDVSLRARDQDGRVSIRHGQRQIELEPSFGQAHNLRNLLAAVAAAGALGIEPGGRLEVGFSALRGERLQLPGSIELINDCYNANPMSMRAALEDLAETAPGRRVAVLGDMLELGPEAVEMHRELGLRASALGVELLLTVGPLAEHIGSTFGGETHGVGSAEQAAALLPALLRAGDTVLVKGSRGVGLERVAQALGAGSGPTPTGPDARGSVVAEPSRRR